VRASGSGNTLHMKSNRLAFTDLDRTSIASRMRTAALVVMLAFAAAHAVIVVRGLGRNLPQVRLELDYAFGIIIAIVLAISILFWPVPVEDKRHLFRVWAVKAVITLGFMLFYEWNYGLDAYGYFDVSRRAQPPGDAGLGDGTVNMQRIAWVLAQVAPNSYHALKVLFSSIGLIGLYLIYRAAAKFTKREDPRILYIVGLFPSCLFWSSILGKDPVQLLGIGLYTYGIVGWVRHRTMHFLLIALMGVLLSMFIRLWTGPILLLPLIVFPIFAMQGTLRRLGVAAALAVVFGYMLVQVTQRFSLASTTDVLALAQRLSESTGWTGGSAISRPVDLSSTTAVIVFMPDAMFTALFRPLPGEVRTFFGTLAGLENAVLLVLVAVAVVRFRRGSVRDPIVLWAGLLVLGWSAVYGMSVYNLGTLVRFKLQILPILLLLLLHLGRFGDSGLRVNANARGEQSRIPLP
jgi:hypothetical protein